MIEFALASFIAFFVTMNPIQTAALFSALTGTMPRRSQRRVAVKSVLIAGGLLAAFALVGDDLLRIIGISLAAVRVGGGILLMLVAIDLVFGRSPGPAALAAGARGSAHADVAVFPLATPIIAGPAAITAVVVESSETDNRLVPLLVILAAIALVMLLSWVAMLTAGLMLRWLGEAGMNVITRILGILLAALSAELMLTGLKHSGVFR